MAKRPIFVSLEKPEHLIDQVWIEFRWNSGFAPVQKRKNIAALHEAANKRGIDPLLEVSSKSEIPLGRQLSAFNLKLDTSVGQISLEAAYQGSKVFEGGGPYTDIYYEDSRTAKKNARLRESGKLVGFNFFGQKWPLEPSTAFYDWLYLTALSPHQGNLARLCEYRGFTDIEFNPKKAVNCQARTCALFVSLIKLRRLRDALRSQQEFIDTISFGHVKASSLAGPRQRQLL